MKCSVCGQSEKPVATIGTGKDGKPYNLCLACIQSPIDNRQREGEQAVSETNKPNADEPKPTMKHTPGPWQLIPCDEWGGEGEAFVMITQSGDFDYSIATVWCDDSGSHIADAHLIAAAPDMLAVLKELEESACYWSKYDVPLGIVDRIKEAIAQAEGR